MAWHQAFSEHTINQYNREHKMCTKHFRNEQWDYSFVIVCLIIYGFAEFYFISSASRTFSICLQIRARERESHLFNSNAMCMMFLSANILTSFRCTHRTRYLQHNAEFRWQLPAILYSFLLFTNTIKCCSLNRSRNFPNKFFRLHNGFLSHPFFFANSYPKG